MVDQGKAISVALKDGKIAGYRFGAPGRPLLLFTHATGFCASVYRKMFAEIGDAFDIFALDMRGHGRSALPADPKTLKSWIPFAEDVDAALDALRVECGLKGDWTMAGHSMGGIVSLLLGAKRADVAGLRLIDPPIVSVPLVMRSAPVWSVFAANMPIVRGAAKRRDHWPDREAVLESYRAKSFFKNWAPGVLEDYLDDGLTEAPDGVRLSCAPAWEAATFSAHGHDVWAALRGYLAKGRPISVWGAGGEDSPFTAFDRRRMRRAGATVIEDDAAGHLWPLERPKEAAQFLLGAEA